MKRLIAGLFGLVILTGMANAQNKAASNRTALSQAASGQATQMANLFKLGDYKGYVKYLHPVMVQVSGGEANLIETLNKQNQQIKGRGVLINSITFDTPTEIVKSNNELQCTIAQQTELKAATNKVITYSTLIAISTDDGKSWKFIDTSNKDIATIRKLFPNLSTKITVPPKRKPIIFRT